MATRKKALKVIRIAIVKADDGFDAVAFVARARAREENRRFLMCLHVEAGDARGTVMVATDGRQLHVAPAPGALIPGDYRVLADTSKAIILETDPYVDDYPSWQKLAIQRWSAGSDIEMSYARSDRARSLGIALYVVMRTCGNGINIAYLDSLHGRDWIVRKGLDKPHMARFDTKDGTWTAIIGLLDVEEGFRSMITEGAAV